MSSSLNIHLFLNKKSTRPRTSCWHHGDVSFVHNRIENSLIQKLDETWSQEGIRVMSPSNSLPISSFFLFPPSLSLPLFLSLFLCHARYALLLSFSFSRSPSHVLFFFFLTVFLPHKLSFLWSFSHLRVIHWNQSWQGRELRTWRRKTQDDIHAKLTIWHREIKHSTIHPKLFHC